MSVGVTKRSAWAKSPSYSVIVAESMESFAIVAAVNDESVLANNLARSPIVTDGTVEFIAHWRYDSASKAYNDAIEQTEAAIVVFAHQDVYLPAGWEAALSAAIDRLEREQVEWQVLGVVGVDRSGTVVGRVWSSGLGREVGQAVNCAEPTGSIDELVIVLRNNGVVRFDEGLGGFHLYGTDIVQSSLQRNLGAYVIDCPVVHNSVPVVSLDRSFRTAYRYMQRKWRAELPIQTTVCRITRSGLPLLAHCLNAKRLALLGPPRRPGRHSDPSGLACQLGYESRRA